MKREVFAFFSILLILNVLSVAVFAEQGSNSESSGSDSGSSDSSGSVKSTTEVRTNLQIKTDASKLRPTMVNNTSQFKAEREKMLNETKKISEERKALFEDAKRLREAQREEMKDARELKRETLKDLMELQREEMKQFREIVKENNGSLEIEDKMVKIKELNDTQKELIAAKINARTGLNLTAADIGNGTKGQELRAWLSNGRFADIKVMPDRASKVALTKLRAKCDVNNCSVELKEVSSREGKRAAYEVKTEKKSRVLFIFPAKMAVQAQVDSETGDLISSKKPWWVFLAKEDNANESEIEDSAGTSTNVESGLTTLNDTVVVLNSSVNASD